MPLRARSKGSRGQILPLFVLCLTAILLMSSLLLDASMALLMRRADQSTADAAALAAANVIQTSGSIRTCSATVGGTPRSDIVAAAKASVHTNLPGYNLNNVDVTCPAADPFGTSYDNFAVRVSLSSNSPGFFSKVVGINAFAVSTTATAFNGQQAGAKWSVVELDPYNSGWSNGKQGCPSVLFSGGPTVTFDGSVHVDSKCPAGSGGSMGTNGNSATITFNNGGNAYLSGGYAPGPLTMIYSPPGPSGPKVNQPQIGDQLDITQPSGLAVVCDRSKPKCNTGFTPDMSTFSSPFSVGAGTNTILSPGIYEGGIQLKSSARAFMKPGVYILDGGGLDLNASSALYSVNSGFSSANPAWTPATWKTVDCLPGACGVLIFNTGTASGAPSAKLSQITVGAGGSLGLRAYAPGAPGNNVVNTTYENLVIWQSKAPVDSSSYQQPIISLGGGGSFDVTGTVYAPSAEVQMLGGSGGGGGNSLDLTIQFISWDLSIQGNSSFHFYYQSNAFAKPMDYGLVE